jgi:arsenate reductase
MFEISTTCGSGWVNFGNVMAKTITVYEKPTCTTCRKLNKLFAEQGIDYKKVNYFIEPLTEEKLTDLLSKAGLEPYDVLRRNEPDFKPLGITKDTAPEEIIRQMVAHPNILQRPIVEIGDRAVLARPIEKAVELIESAN